MMILGKYFPPSTVVSVPSYTIHRDPTVWGDDVEEYRPERWFECDSTAILKTFNPFSVGPRYVANPFHIHSRINQGDAGPVLDVT